MTDFITFEAEVDSESDLSDNDEDIDEDLNDFIVSDHNVTQDSRTFYRSFENVENDLDQILEQSRQQAFKDLEEFDEISNLDEENVMEMEIDDFSNAQQYLQKFEKTLRPETNNQICNVIIKAIEYHLKGNVPAILIEKINQPQKYKFIIDHQYFFNMCYELTMVLSQFGYFLRIFELKKKFRHLFLKKPDEQKIVKQLSSCITERFNGFTIIRSEYAKKVRREFSPIDIIYKPSKNIEIEPLCYYSSDISLAYSATYSRKNRKEKGRANKTTINLQRNLPPYY